MVQGKWIVLGLHAIVCSAQAFIEAKIDEKKPFEVTLSRTSHNRIGVKNGTVEKVIGNGSIFSLTIDANTGNAFVNLLQDILDKPTTLTIVTGSGMMQDLTVSSREGPAEHISLIEEEGEETFTLSPFSHAFTVTFLNQILEGNVPFGYGQRPILETERLELPTSLSVQALKAFEGSFEEILVYEIENTGKQSIVITADAVKQEHNSWVFLNARELRPKERVLCVIGNQKGANQ